MTASTRVFHPIAQTTLVVLHMQVDTIQFENVYNYLWNNTTPPSDAELLALCVEFGSTVGEKTRQMMVTAISMIDVTARNLDIATGNSATSAFTSGTHGALVGGAVPGNAVGSLTTRTGHAGYGQHGSKRIGFCDQLSYSGNSISGTHMGRFANLCLSIVANRVAGRFLPAIPHINPLGIGHSTALTFAGMLDSDIDSQKTRLNGHGS